MREREISRLLAEREGGECEVRTPAGSIDVLTARCVYEVKVAHQWKAALGQVLAYARAYPDRKPQLYLYGETGGMTKKAIEDHCRAVGVGVVWHRDGDVAPREAKPRAMPADAMKLTLTAVDASYGIRCQSALTLPIPAAPIELARLDAYADQALAAFDALLDNELTLTLTTMFQGERWVVERHRPAIQGDPVCYQLQLTVGTGQYRSSISTSLPGARRRIFAIAGAPDSVHKMNHARRKLPELQQLEALITHPEFPWMSIHGFRAVKIETARYRNYGIVQGKNGPKIGGR